MANSREHQEVKLSGSDRLLQGFGPHGTFSNVLVPHSRVAVENLARAFHGAVTNLPGFGHLAYKVPEDVFVLWFFAVLYSRWALLAERHGVSIQDKSGQIIQVRKLRTRLAVDMRSLRLPEFLHLVMGQFGPVRSEAVGLTFWPVFSLSDAPTEAEIAKVNLMLPHINAFISGVSVLTPVSDSAPALDQPGGWGSILVANAMTHMVQHMQDELSVAATEVQSDMGKSVGSPVPAVRSDTPSAPGMTVESDPGNSLPNIIPMVPVSLGGGFMFDSPVNVLGPTNEAKPLHALIAAVLRSASRPRGILYGVEYGGSENPQSLLGQLFDNSIRYTDLAANAVRQRD